MFFPKRLVYVAFFAAALAVLGGAACKKGSSPTTPDPNNGVTTPPTVISGHSEDYTFPAGVYTTDINGKTSWPDGCLKVYPTYFMPSRGTVANPTVLHDQDAVKDSLDMSLCAEAPASIRPVCVITDPQGQELTGWPGLCTSGTTTVAPGGMITLTTDTKVYKTAGSFFIPPNTLLAKVSVTAQWLRPDGTTGDWLKIPNGSAVGAKAGIMYDLYQIFPG